MKNSKKTRWDYRKLKAWDEAMNLWVMIYDITKNFPTEERFNLISQMRRCTVSIASNIAEWNERKSDKDFFHFLTIALGSCVEIETQLEWSRRIKFIEDKRAKEIFDKISLIKRLIQWVKNSLEK